MKPLMPIRDAVVARAHAAGVVEMVTAGTGLASCRRALALTERYEDVYAAIAVHPQDASEATPQVMAELRTLTERPKVVAAGETGLDFTRGPDHQIQRDVFRAHVRLAADRHLPVVIHCREAYPDVLDILKEEGATKVIMHAFSGSVEIARRCVAAGYAISLGGPVTYTRSIYRLQPVNR